MVDDDGDRGWADFGIQGGQDGQDGQGWESQVELRGWEEMGGFWRGWVD